MNETPSPRREHDYRPPRVPKYPGETDLELYARQTRNWAMVAALCVLELLILTVVGIVVEVGALHALAGG